MHCSPGEVPRTSTAVGQSCQQGAWHRGQIPACRAPLQGMSAPTRPASLRHQWLLVSQAALHPSDIGARRAEAAQGGAWHGRSAVPPVPHLSRDRESWRDNNLTKFGYFPNFLNVQLLSVYFKFLATESLRIQVERKVSSTGG